jgi:muramoyltetrapeptide carboxypeptidase
VLPPYLNGGDLIGIAAPARKVSKEELAEGILFLESQGFRVKEAPNLYGSQNQFSGSDEERASDFQLLLDDPDVKAIICARGGYGVMRIIDRLDFTAFKAHPKWIIGFSDMTVFFSHLVQNFSIAGIHAPMLFNLTNEKRNAASWQNVYKILTGTPIRYSIPASVSTEKLNRAGTATGILTGGNLSLMYALSGSASDVNTDGKILFLEDLDEYLYHIDRMMMQLKRSGKLRNLKGLIIGGMSDMKDNTIPFGKNAEEIIAEAVSEYNYPVFYGFPAGHIPENYPLVMGAEVTMIVKDQLELQF